MAKLMQYPVQLFHKHKRESAIIPDYVTHKKMEPKWVQDYDAHKVRGEIEWLQANEISWKDELIGLEQKAIEARAVRIQENKENEERSKIDAKRKELLAKYEAKKKLEAEKAQLAAIAKELGEEIPEYMAPKPVEKPVFKDEQLEEVKPKKKLFGKPQINDSP